MKIRRALLSVSDKTNLVELAKALLTTGAELVATGKSAVVIKEAGLKVTAIEVLTGSPESFNGRMKTLSFNVCSGILYRRGNQNDEKNLLTLGVKPIDAVVVNFYPFEKYLESNVSDIELIEQIDIGGPTLVRAAAKNKKDVLVLTSPSLYKDVISDLKQNGEVSNKLLEICAKRAWGDVYNYDKAIASKFGKTEFEMSLRYGENPHQKARILVENDSPISWDKPLTNNEISYNNILDLSAAYALARDIKDLDNSMTGVVVFKHQNPCGVALIPKSTKDAQKQALIKAWEGDPVSAFGGVLVFTDPLTMSAVDWVKEKFIEAIAVPQLNIDSPELLELCKFRKKLKAVSINSFEAKPKEMIIKVPGATLYQDADLGLKEEKLESVTRLSFPKEKESVALFGIAVCRKLKSNTIAIVRNIPDNCGGYQLVGAGQGQPNRVEALEKLALPRAINVLGKSSALVDCVLISDAFFPFPDSVEIAGKAGIRYIAQPGGSIKDKDVINECNMRGIAMVFTGRRHFLH